MNEVVERTLYLAPVGENTPSTQSNDRDGRLRRLKEQLSKPMPSDGVWGWLGPLLVTAIAAGLRFYQLGRPKRITLDETYYVKGGLSLPTPTNF